MYRFSNGRKIYNQHREQHSALPRELTDLDADGASILVDHPFPPDCCSIIPKCGQIERTSVRLWGPLTVIQIITV